jgi:putative aminopeptidase FrvX
LKTLKILKELSPETGPSGREAEVRQRIADYWSSLSDELSIDALGNLIALKKGNGANRRSVMLATHMDEIAFIVTGIEGEFLRITNLGGTDRRAILGSEVCVHGRHKLPGVIGSRPPHILAPADRNKIPPWREIFVDVGLPEEELHKTVRIGDTVTMSQPLREMKNQRIAGKALDNRVSVVAATIALQLLKQRWHTWDVFAVATVQEEVGLYGATTSAYGVAPDIAIAIDVTFAKQYNDSEPGTFELDKGPTIGIGPNLHPAIVKRLRETAEQNEIPIALEPLSGSSGTDAWAIQVAREGIPCGLLSIPVRYMHQPVETASLNDIERTGRLLAEFITNLESDFSLRWDPEVV